MGRDKPKKYNKMNYQQKEVYVKNQLKEYGGGGAVYYDNGGARGSASTGMFDLEASEKNLAKAMNNNYDIRESIKYGKDSGDKRFADLGSGISNMSEAVNAQRAIQKYGKNELGQKNTSSANDFGNISESLFNASRSNLTDSMSANEQQAQAEKGTSEPATPSAEMSEARERVENFDNKDYGVYGNSEAGDNEDQRSNAANSFLDKYKLDVKAGANFQPTI